ncbi:hypothetical protein CCHL11_03130 [Colletotrichum chlorophyti]|uniref:Uncharacterized protein n=1 Tax=Colletotrichum chlorophyti TaxID=708187 RepID=A0A1Q8RGD1_9PEZI|nr:hypothetical protein CCHL11_03130 [Colletotrichum chlorophyti]
MAMGIQQQQHQGSPPMFPGDFVEYTHYDTSDASRQPRETGRNGRYRRVRSPSLDDDSRFTTGSGEGPRPPNSDAAMHDAVIAQQQQRAAQTGQLGRGSQPRVPGPRSGPPSMAQANASQNRRSQPPPVNAQLPPYIGENSDEWSPAGGQKAGDYSRRRTERHARRQSSTGSRAPAPSEPPQISGGASPRGGPPTGPELQNSPRVNAAPPPAQQQQPPLNPAGLRPPSPPGLDAPDRINSPSVSKSVLEPLQRKMFQYHNLMDEAQGQMSQLDDEIRALQERRRQAEQRFVDAKTKHDEYERQHLDVERALRGDFHPPQPQPVPQQQQQQPQQQQQQMYNSSPPRTMQRPASSIMSYDDRPMSGHSSGPKKGKLRFSLFGR